tara:strand:- start:1174 stop:1518 length:345 start_codon:yes stop_codon:yes gene_type:complete
MRNISETPESWVILKIKSNETYYRVFAGWGGGYLDADKWKMNSGIVGIEEDDEYYYFEGHSGSCYKCDKNSYGLKNGEYWFASYVQQILMNIIEKSPVPIEILDENVDFNKLLE